MPTTLRSTISHTYLERIRTSPDLIGFQYKAHKASNWTQVTFRQFNQECRIISAGLAALGIQSNDKIAILSATRFEWALVDMAILGAKAVTIPIYPSSSPNDLAYILNHSECSTIFVENEKQLEKVLEKRDALPLLKKVIVFQFPETDHFKNHPEIISLRDLHALGNQHLSRYDDVFEKNLASARPDDLLTICYTSGTTGTPKGVLLTHDNMVSVLEDCGKVLGENLRPENEVLVTFLPFSHVLGKVEEMGTYAFGWRECYTDSLENLMKNIGDIRPTILFAVPRIFEKAYNAIHNLLDSGPAPRRRFSKWAVDVGNDYSADLRRNKKPSLKKRAEQFIAKTLVLDKINRRFGGRINFVICGGAPLPKEIGEFFSAVGIPILEGYGLTETCAPIAFNIPGKTRFGSVGHPLPDVRIKIAEDGELCVQSRKIFKSYHKMPAETAEVFEDGWFRTGDIGYTDNDGYLYITDRKKDLIITSGGKNIAPQKIENLARTYRYLSQFVVHGDRRNYLTALITLDREQITRYARENQIFYKEYEDLIQTRPIHDLVQKTLDDINAQLATFETIKKFVIVPNEFAIETGELTPSLKVKRNVVNRKFQAELDGLYSP